jgi:hypothetical protein
VLLAVETSSSSSGRHGNRLVWIYLTRRGYSQTWPDRRSVARQRRRWRSRNAPDRERRPSEARAAATRRCIAISHTVHPRICRLQS